MYKEPELELRTQDDNAEFFEHLQDAQTAIAKAIGEISYSAYPSVNGYFKHKLSEIAGDLSRLEYGINNDIDLNLYKPKQ